MRKKYLLFSLIGLLFFSGAFVACGSQNQDEISNEVQTLESDELDVPEITSVMNVSEGIQIMWQAVSNAEKYRVFRKTGNNNWEAIATTSSRSYIDTNVTVGVTYKYTVRCVSDDGKKYTSEYDPSGKTITCQTMLETPQITKIVVLEKDILITWDEIAGAEQYRVFRKTEGGTWETLITTKSLQYTDKTAKQGVTYRYTVRCVASDGTTYTSGYDANGKTVSY